MSPFKCTCEPLRACGNFSGGVKMRGVRKDSKACVSVGLAAVSNNMPLLPKQQVPGRLHLRKKGVLLEGIKRHRFMSEGNVRKEMEQSYNSSSSKVPRTGLERLHPTAPRERRGSDSIGSACTGRSGPCGQQGLRGDSKDRRDRFLVECGVILDMKVLGSFGNPGVPNPDYSSLMIALGVSGVFFFFFSAGPATRYCSPARWVCMPDAGGETSKGPTAVTTLSERSALVVAKAA